MGDAVKVRWVKTEDSSLRYVPKGTEAEVDGETAKRLIAEGLVEPVAEKSERAVRTGGGKAVKQ